MEDNRNKLLLQYAGLGFQLLVTLLLSIWVGQWIDRKLNLHFPLLLWILPLLIISGMIVKAIRDTTKK